MTYLEFKKEWLGKRVDYDQRYQFQCTDLIRQYLLEVIGIYGNPAQAWGNAIDYWTKPHANILTHFEKSTSKTPAQGDIIILDLAAPYGHIAIADSATTMLEQNGGNGNGDGKGSNAIRISKIPTIKIIGILKPKKEEKMDTFTGDFGGKKTTKNAEGWYKSAVRYLNENSENAKQVKELELEIVQFGDQIYNVNKEMLKLEKKYTYALEQAEISKKSMEEWEKKYYQEHNENLKNAEELLNEQTAHKKTFDYAQKQTEEIAKERDKALKDYYACKETLEQSIKNEAFLQGEVEGLVAENETLDRKTAMLPALEEDIRTLEARIEDLTSDLFNSHNERIKLEEKLKTGWQMVVEGIKKMFNNE